MLLVPGVTDGRAGRRAGTPGHEPLHRPVSGRLQLREIVPVLAVRAAADPAVADPAFDLALRLGAARGARIDAKAQRLRVAAVDRMRRPQAPAPATIAVFSLSTRIVAGTPPRRVSAALWTCSHDSRSRRSLKISAQPGENDSCSRNASRSRRRPPSPTRGKTAQSACARAPGGVSTRSCVRFAGAGNTRRRYRCSERRLPG